MWCCSAFVVTNLLGIISGAYVPRSMPIKWIGSEEKEMVLVPRDFVARFNKNLVAPQTLKIIDSPENLSPTMIPRFTVNYDETITFDSVGWCVAGDRSSNTVRVDWCTGGPDQKWKWIPDRQGKYMVQLKGAHACLGVTDALHGAVGLRKCDHQLRESWRFEEVAPLPWQRPSEALGFSSSARHLMISMFVVAGISFLGLGLRSRPWIFAAPRERDGPNCASFAVDRHNGVAMAVPEKKPSWVGLLQRPTVDGGEWTPGGGDGGGENKTFMRCLNPDEQTLVINAWTAKALVYSMGASADGEEVNDNAQVKQLERLEQIRGAFNKEPFMLAALFENAPELQQGQLVDANEAQKVLAIAGAELRTDRGTLTVEQVAFYPPVLNSQERTTEVLQNTYSFIFALAESQGVQPDLNPFLEEVKVHGIL